MRNIAFALLASSVLATPVLAGEPVDQPGDASADAPADTSADAQAAPAQEVFSTGVARGRDRLDSATSTSVFKSSEFLKLGPRPFADVIRAIPGLRVESAVGEGNANYTVRGLPLASGGAKYLQLQEDGLPVLEFGDFFNFAADVFIRADFNVAQIESIRGGSSSTFSSNSPGGLINLMSKTGETGGGAVQLTSGIDYGERRIDFDYGEQLGGGWRFHIGGFYRQGEGPRDIGYTGYKGGQIRLNVTKQFDTGYIRLHAKYLQDRSPTFAPYPIQITGTNDNPTIRNFPGFDIRSDATLSPFIGDVVTLDGQNQLRRFSAQTGMAPVSKSIGLEAQFDVAGFTVSNKARYSANSGDFLRVFPSSVNTVNGLAAQLGGAGATARYASGPLAGQPIAAGSPINGNGLLMLSFMAQTRARSLDYFVNDLRASRVWNMGGGALTVTGGLYAAEQELFSQWLHSSIVTDVAGNGRTAMVDITSAGGVAQTQGGYFSFARGNSSRFRRVFDVDYSILAPYGSVNYHVGKLAIGGSLRYDRGQVRGSLVGADLGGGRVGLTSFDVNGDGAISVPETRVGFLQFDRPAPVDYDYGFLSYSAGVNYRVSEPLALFARYSRGGRANADKILFTAAVAEDGSVPSKADRVDEVRQLEGGFKFRRTNMTLNATAFLAYADDHNVLNGSANATFRTYRAYGLELEGSFRHGPFSIAGGATYTTAKITEDKFDASLTGKEPRRQPAWTITLMPQLEFDRVNVGANIVTITSSYAQDENILRIPGFTTVNAFALFKPVARVQLMVNASNLFNQAGFFDINQSQLPANGIGWGRSINGRTVSASLRYDF